VNKSIEKDSKLKQSINETLEKYGKLRDEGQFTKYEYKGQSYYLMILKVKDGVKFKFNSKTIWETRFGSKTQFTDQTVFSKLPGKKLVIIYPSTGPYMYQYDENEIRFTKPSEKVWDMTIIGAHELDEVLKEGLK